jgi:hypothetical protein
VSGLRNLKPTAPKGKGDAAVRHTTSRGEVVSGAQPRGDGRKGSGLTPEAKRGLGIGKR